MSRLSLFIISALVMLGSRAHATTTYLRCVGVDSNFTYVQGDTFTWQADCDTGADVMMEIWIDLNGNRQIDEGTDYAWQSGFVMTDGGPGGNGPGDMDGQANGEIYFAMQLGIAPGDWILRATDGTDMSSQTCWGTVTPILSPDFVITGQVGGPGGFDPENRLVAYDDNGGMWQALTDAGGTYYLNMAGGFAEGDTVSLECSDAAGYVTPSKLDVILPPQGDTLYGVDHAYNSPAAQVFGFIKDNRDSIVTDGEAYVVYQVDGGNYQYVQVNSDGSYIVTFDSSQAGQDWRFSVHYNSMPADHMQPSDSTFTVNMDDSIEYDFMALYTDTFFTGTVTEDGGSPSGSYRLRYWSNLGGTEAYSDAGNGTYTMPISSLIDSNVQGNVSIDTSADEGTPLPAGYTVDGNWSKPAVGGDVVDFDLVQGAVIMGRLISASDSSSGLGYYNQVELTDWNWSMNDQQQTDSSGYFSYDVSPGDYRIYVQSDQGYNGQWFDGQQDENSAETLTVTGGETLYVEIFMVNGSSISGTVLDTDSNAVINLGVEARDAYTGSWMGQTSTDSSGYYELTDLTAGAYFVRTFSDNGYIGEYFDDVYDSRDADTLFLGAGSNQGGIDFSLVRGNTVSGYVFDEDSNAVINLQVEVYDTNQNSYGQSGTDSSGYYEISGISDGVYTLYAHTDQGLIGEYWQDKQNDWEADYFMLSGGVDSTGFDFYLAQGLVLGGYVLAESDSAPVVNIQVELKDANQNYIDQQSTDSTGYYEFTGLATGDYKIEVMSGNGFIGEWYEDQEWGSMADTISLASDSSFDFYLAQGLTISGYVYDEADSSPVYDMQVEAYDATKMTAGTGYTDSSGYYEITGLPVDIYTLGIQDRNGYIGEYWLDRQESWMADTIAAVSDTGGFDFYLTRGSSISGEVRDEGDSSGVFNIRVSLYDSSDNHQGDQWTDSTGMFRFDGLAAGSYKLYVESNYGYAGEWYQDRDNSGSADFIVLGTADDQGGFFMYVGSGASLSGYIYDEADSTPVYDMEVRLNDFNMMYSDQTYTDSSGYFEFTGLSANNYRLSTDTRNGYGGEYWLDRDQDWEADTIALGSADTSGFDMYISKLSFITGTVQAAADSMPLTSVEVRISDGMSYSNSAWTDSSGYFEVSVPAGAYFAFVSSPPGNYIGQVYNGQPLYDYVDTLDIASGDTLAGIDFYLAEGGVVVGNVRRMSDSTAVKYEEVRVYDLAGNFVSSDWTDSNGDYEVSGLAPDDYYVYTWAGGNLINQYYDGAYDTSTATAVTVISGDTVSGIDFLLPEPGVIAGYVVSDTGGGDPLGGMDVYLYDVSDSMSSVSSTTTDGNGFYAFENVDPGDYYLIFNDMSGTYREEYYSDAFNFADADTVTQDMPGDTVWVPTEGLDIRRGTLLGTVFRSTDTTGVESVMVELYNDYGYDDDPYLAIYTDTTGAFVFDGLPANVNFFVKADGMNLNYTNLWYDGSFTRGSANSVNIPAEDTATADFMLDPGATVSGTVYAALDSAAVESAYVVLLLESDSSDYAEALTGADGSFTLQGIAATNYLFAVYAGNQGYGTTWWPGDASIDSAELVAFSAGQDTGGFDFYLEASGSISGYVYSASDSSALTDMRVDVVNGSGSWVMDGETDSTGRFVVDGLVPGTYYLQARDDYGYLGQWWSGQTDFSSADTVELVNAADTAGFDFYLTPGAIVYGRLERSADGENVNTSYEVQLISDQGDTMTTSGWNNYYVFTDLVAGSYWVQYRSSYYMNTVSDTFTVAAGDTVGSHISLEPRVVINEIYYDGGSAQYSLPGNPEFVELYVVDDVNLANWTVNDRNMYNWSTMDSLPAAAGDYAVFHMDTGTDTTIGSVHHIYCSTTNALGDNGGYVGLNAPDGNAVDLVVYENGPGWPMGSSSDFVGWPNDGSNPDDKGAAATDDSRSISLMPDGIDNNTSDDWYETFITPGAANELPVYFEELVADTGTFTFDGIGAVLTFTDSLGGSDTVSVRVYPDSLPPNLPSGNPIARFYQISAGAGLTGFTVVVTFTYTQDEFNASDITDETQIYAARWDGSEWVPYASTVDTANNTVTFTTTQFSLWSLGGPGGSVPVELSSFTAQEAGGAVELAWTTASEEANLGWHVYRSLDGGAFEQLTSALVAGAGFSAMPQEYGYTDAAVPAGASSAAYYLLQVDAGGATQQSATVTVDFGTSGLADRLTAGMPVFLSGNPVAGTMRMAFRTERTGTVHAAVYDMAGNTVTVLADGIRPAGTHIVTWDTAAAGAGEGLHVVRLSVDGHTVSAVVTVVK